ncbi:hypothetical protein FAI41_02320 [Acetobacteraceae bacterium]|nr:hypothetical protein FAI41_02320 [Acetobacteraceae bacterium]
MQDRYNPSSHIEPQMSSRDSFNVQTGSEYPVEQPNAFPGSEGSHPVRPALPPSSGEFPEAFHAPLSPSAPATKKKRSPSFLWIFAQFTACLITQIADIIAPLLLVLGCAWALLPVFSRLATDALAEADPQTKELAVQVISQLPSHVKIAGISWSAFGIIALALFLMIGSAFSVTWQAYLNKQNP